MPDLDTIFDVASRRLPAAGVDCLLIGGFAVNQYGYTRNTLDVDFMIVSEQRDRVRRIMTAAGFPNVSAQSNVTFFSAAGVSWRVDFLTVDGPTLQKLLARAVPVEIRGFPLKVPALKDLLAMKIFSLSQGAARRMGKDLPDIVYLSVLNDLDIEKDLRPICDRFGTPELFRRITGEIEALKSP